MKILRLSTYCYPEQVSSTHLSNDLNEAMVKEGWILETYAPTPSRGISDEIRNKYKKIKYEERMDGHFIIHRFCMIKEGRNPIRRALKYTLTQIVQYYKAIKTADVDCLYSGSTPPTQGLLFGRVKKKLSKKYGHPVPYVYNLQDLFPDSLVNSGMTKKGSFIYRIGRKIEDYTYKNADVIITISEDFKQIIMNKGVPENKIVVIPNWVNVENVFPVDKQENVLFERYGLDKNKFYICYSGNLGKSQNLELLVDTAKRIADSMPQIHFLIIGEGVAKEGVLQKIKEDQIGNITVLPFQDYSEIAHVFSIGDVGLIISKPGIGTSSVPSKTWSIMAAERPILASFDLSSDLSKLVNENGFGIAVEAGNIDALVEAIETLYQSAELRNSMGKKGKEYLKTYLDKDKCVSAYLDAIKSVVPEKNL